MFNKECTDDPLFEKLAIAYAEASPSADAYSFVAGVLAKKRRHIRSSRNENEGF